MASEHCVIVSITVDLEMEFSWCWNYQLEGVTIILVQGIYHTIVLSTT
jgi:hypothetical protein